MAPECRAGSRWPGATSPPTRSASAASLGYMPEHDCLPLDQTASDIVATFGELAGLPVRAARQRASDVLDLVGLDEARFRPVGGFSTGMRQRTKLAQALVADPAARAARRAHRRPRPRRARGDARPGRPPRRLRHLGRLRHPPARRRAAGVRARRDDRPRPPRARRPDRSAHADAPVSCGSRSAAGPTRSPPWSRALATHGLGGAAGRRRTGSTSTPATAARTPATPSATRSPTSVCGSTRCRAVTARSTTCSSSRRRR